jgi:hypothetical protein
MFNQYSVITDIIFIHQTKETKTLLNYLKLTTKLYLKNTNIKNEMQNATFLLFWAPSAPHQHAYESSNVSDL